MTRYDPVRAPRPDEWLALDEGERMLLVEEYHRRARIRLPNLRLHAVMHTIVENQLAERAPVVVETFDRLRADGLSRHDAIHAVGSVLVVHLRTLMMHQAGPGDPNLAYERALRELTAERWRRG